MKVYFMLERFFPEITASGNLLVHLIKKFDEDFKVVVLCNAEENNTDQYEKIDIIRFENNVEYHRILHKIVKPQVSINEKMEIYLTEILLDSHEQIILIPITISEIKLSIKLKKSFKNRIILMPFLLEILPQKFRDSRRIKKELEIYSDKLFILPKLEKYFLNLNKICVVEHPMVVDNINENKQQKNINVTYIGGLDRRNRNPRKIIEMIKKINNKEINFNFYGYGNMDKYLFKQGRLISNFNFYGSIKQNEAKQILNESSILISIGNKNHRLVPSKLFDYISTGNPIIHFYQNYEDPYIDYLKKYDYSLCVNYNDINIKEVECFINDHYFLQEELAVIKKNYLIFTPDFVYQQFLEQVNNYEK